MVAAGGDPVAVAGLSRRGFLGRSVGLAAVGVGVGAVAGYSVAQASESSGGTATSDDLGSQVIDFYGPHQAGIETPLSLSANATLVAFDLRAGTDRAALVGLMKVWTDDAARLTAGRPALADPDSTLADVPAGLTITVGYGAGLLRAAGLADQSPDWLGPLPDFPHDSLQARWSGGDLVAQVAAADPVTVSHAVNVLVRDSADIAGVRWAQTGFHRSAATAPPGTGRNLMGQVDGTVNPAPGTADFADVVWNTGDPAWLAGGTGMVVRRIAMDLPVWGSLDQRAKEEAIGRRLADGAPLTGGDEFTAPDYEALDANGFPVIPTNSHIRLARPGQAGERILRRPFNYDEGFAAGKPDAGLVFVAFAADVQAQFVPIQTRVSESDVMNIWLTPIGSAVFALPPGVAPGEYLGQGLLGN